MSDALCGPANPLQQFKQQSQLDRTLQQDRLTSRHSPANAFRSADPRAGLLDPEFEAFQAGLPPSELPHLPTFQQQPARSGEPSQAAPSWAADFQRMHISPPPSLQQQQQFIPQSSHAGSDWTQGFREHITQAAPRAQNSSPSPQAFQYMARYGMNGYQNNFAQPPLAQSAQSKGKEAVTEQFDEAAFERAFDEARDAMMAGEKPMEDVDQDVELPYVRGASTGNDEATAHEFMTDHTLHSQAALGLEERELENLLQDPVAEEMLRENISQVEEQQKDDIKQANDDDALALTAQELLEKVQHNQTDKFRNSQFLGLMRRLRDREVKVEGDKMVETVRAPPFNKHLPSPPTSAPDSAYASGPGTPDPIFNSGGFQRYIRTPPPEFDTHMEYGWGEEHEFDHWESPYQ